jgi:hypothetical protein
MNSRPWWDDENYQAKLNEKIATGQWYVSARGGRTCGKVIKIAYNGYKIELPDASTVIIHPIKDRVKDLNEEQYQKALKVYEDFQEQERQRIQSIRDAEEALRKKQAECLHEDTNESCVIKAAGCDVDDTVCNTCGKVLRRSWSTAYDRDPDDAISDWNWWVRTCVRLYGKEPRREDYNVCEDIQVASSLCGKPYLQ